MSHIGDFGGTGKQIMKKFLIPLSFLFVLSSPLMAQLTKVWGHVWYDLFDEPAQTQGELRLKGLDGAETRFAPEAGKVTVLVEIDPDAPWWTEKAKVYNIAINGRPREVKHSKAENLERYKELVDIFKGKDVTFVPVWTNRYEKDGSEKQAAAQAYKDERKLPGELYVGDVDALARYLGLDYPNDNAYIQREHVSRHGMSTENSMGSSVAVIDGKGRIVFRKRGSFDSNAIRLAVQRAIDPAFDKQVRHQFADTRPWKNREVTAEGLLYKEDFEGFKDSFEFKLNNRWGFNYENQSRIENRGEIAPGTGLNGSKALYANSRWYHMNNIKSDYTTYHNLPHYEVATLYFPAPLADGYFKFRFKRGPADELAGQRELHKATEIKNRETGYGIRIMTSHHEAVVARNNQNGGFIKGNGAQMRHECLVGRVGAWPKSKDSKEDVFTHASKPNRFTDMVCGDDWYEVEVRCTPGKPAEMFINGTSIGELMSHTITSVYFTDDLFKPGIYVDDIELFYRGDSTETASEHDAKPWPREYELNTENPDDDKIDMVKIPGGTFMQGNEDQGTHTLLYGIGRPVREVTLSPYSIGKFPVTYGQYRRVYEWAHQNGYKLDSGINGDQWKLGGQIFCRDHNSNPDHPVRAVCPFNQYKWCNALSEMEGKTPCYYTDSSLKTVYRTGEIDLENSFVKWDADGYRLPTAAEWQFAFLGTSGHPLRYWGDSGGDRGHNPAYYGHGGHPHYTNFPCVGTVPPNEYGIYDMGFWYESCWDVSYPWPAGPAHNPKGGTVENGQETQDYIERSNVLSMKHELRRGGKADAAKSKACGRTLMACFGYEGGDGYNTAHGHYAYKRADHIASWHTTDGTFRLAVSDPETPGGSYTKGKPELVEHVPPKMNSVVVDEGEVQGDFIKVRKIPAGKYKVGGTRKHGMLLSAIFLNNTPVREVSLDEYWIGKTEITFEQYQKVHDWASKNGYTFSSDENWKKRYLMKGRRDPNPSFEELNPDIKYTANPAPTQPVNHVCWYDAVKWCNALSEMEAKTPCYYTSADKKEPYRSGEIDLTPDCVNWKAGGYRLPTEAEWESACRGGTDTKYFFGDALNGDYLWYNRNLPTTGALDTRCYFEVATKKPNPFGLYDMHGNIFEWCFDWLGPYNASATNNPKGCSKDESAKAHQKLVDERDAKVGPEPLIWDADPVEKEFSDDAFRKKMLKSRQHGSRKKGSPLPSDAVFCRAKRVQRGGADWGSAKRFGSDPLWSRHDQGFRVVLSP